MGICYPYKEFIGKRTHGREDAKLTDIYNSLKIKTLNFTEVYHLLFDYEEIKSLPIFFFDKSMMISIKKFLSISNDHFYENSGQNKYLQYHELIFKNIAQSASNRWHIEKLELWKIMMILLPLLIDSDEDKLEYFLKLFNEYFQTEDKISNERFSKAIRIYLEYILIFSTKVIININRTLLKNNYNEELMKNYKLFCNKDNFISFLTTISPYLSPAHEDGNMSINEIKENLKNYMKIFDFFEARKLFLSMVKDQPNSDYDSYINYTFVDLESTI